MQVRAMIEGEVLCQWCSNDDVVLTRHQVKVGNAQVDSSHSLYRCLLCHRLTLVAFWENRRYFYRALEKRQFLLATIYLIIYPVVCVWCGKHDQIEPVEINATVAHSISRHHRYDIYACYACDRYTAVSYLGDITTFHAIQDSTYPSLYHLKRFDEVDVV